MFIGNYRVSDGCQLMAASLKLYATDYPAGSPGRPRTTIVARGSRLLTNPLTLGPFTRGRTDPVHAIPDQCRLKPTPVPPWRWPSNSSRL